GTATVPSPTAPRYNWKAADWELFDRTLKAQANQYPQRSQCGHSTGQQNTKCTKNIQHYYQREEKLHSLNSRKHSCFRDPQIPRQCRGGPTQNRQISSPYRRRQEMVPSHCTQYLNNKLR